MQLANMKEEVLEDKTSIKSYDIVEMNTKDDLFALLDNLSDSYGKLGNIVSKEVNENQRVLFAKLSENLDAFVGELSNEDFRRMTNYKAYCLNGKYSFEIDTKSSKLQMTDITNRELKYMENPDNMEYYMFERLYPVKRDKAIDTFYRKNSQGELEEIPYFIDKYLDPNYLFENITEEEFDSFNMGGLKK